MNVHGALQPTLLIGEEDLQKRTEMQMGTDVTVERYSRATEK